MTCMDKSSVFAIKSVPDCEEVPNIPNTVKVEMSYNDDVEAKVDSKNIKDEYENKVLMNIEQEEIHIKDEIPTISLPDKSFHCNLCPYKAICNSTLEWHMRTHTGEKPFACNLCQYKTAFKGDLERHFRIHTREKKFVCTLCRYETDRKGSFTIHLKSHEKEYQCACNLCQHKAAQINCLINNYACNLCEFRTSCKTSFDRHIRIHTKEITCNFCQYKTSVKCNLKRHSKIHTGETPYLLDLRDFEAARKTNLKNHMKKHLSTELKLAILNKIVKKK